MLVNLWWNCTMFLEARSNLFKYKKNLFLFIVIVNICLFFLNMYTEASDEKRKYIYNKASSKKFIFFFSLNKHLYPSYLGLTNSFYD